MVPYDLFFYTWAINIATPAGAILGSSTGWLIARVFKEGKRGATMILVDIAAGIIGFVGGACLAVVGGGSVYEVWENGKLVIRETAGLVDYLHLLAIAGSVLLVAAIHIAKMVIKRLPCKGKTKRDYTGAIRAV